MRFGLVLGVTGVLVASLAACIVEEPPTNHLAGGPTGATHAGSIDGGTVGTGSEDEAGTKTEVPAAPGTCKGDSDCACGSVCRAGTCEVSDCSDVPCPTGRSCTCERGIRVIEGRSGAQYPTADVVFRTRPMTTAEDGSSLSVRNLHVHHVDNMKAVHVTASTCGNGPHWTYRDVALRCIEVDDVHRVGDGVTNGVHLDYIKIDGCVGSPKTNVLLEDVNVHDGNIYSLVSDAEIGVMTLRRVKHFENTGGALQIGSVTIGFIDEVIVDDSPELHTALLGHIGIVRVRNSPGYTGGQGTTVPVVYDAASCPKRTLGANESCSP